MFIWSIWLIFLFWRFRFLFFRFRLFFFFPIVTGPGFSRERYGGTCLQVGGDRCDFC